jgi:hypothetical protein
MLDELMYHHNNTTVQYYINYKIALITAINL